MGCHCGEKQCSHQVQDPKKTRTFENGDIPPYLPQPSDSRATAEDSQMVFESGPWAFGRVTWSPSAKLVGVRPVVDRYSITRYSLKDWRKKNEQVLEMAFNTDKLKHNVQCTIDTIVSGADKHQTDNTKRLQERVRLVRVCKDEIEQLVKDLREEIVLLTETKVKLKFALPALKVPESIAGECIDRRTTRLEADLVNDDVEIQLSKELSLIKESRLKYESAVGEVESQMLKNRACKDQLEHNWSDKKETCELESINTCLRNNTPIIHFYGGATRTPDNQSSPESWGIFNVTAINLAKEELNRSRKLRTMVENEVMGSTNENLKKQADKVYEALRKRVEETDQCRQMFERELQDVLRQIVDAESLYDGLVKIQRQLEQNIKVVQTRMNNRLQRPRMENCRDEPQYGMLDEVQFLNESLSKAKSQIDDIDKTVSKLYKVRSNLEYVILTKRKSLYVDQQRCMAYREKYPDLNSSGDF